MAHYYSAVYTKALDDRGLALSTITSYVSAIGTIHSAVNERSPTRSRVVKSEVAKLRAKHADAQRHARPLSDEEKDRILKVLPQPRRSKGGHLELPETARKRAYGKSVVTHNDLCGDAGQ